MLYDSEHISIILNIPKSMAEHYLTEIERRAESIISPTERLLPKHIRDGLKFNAELALYNAFMDGRKSQRITDEKVAEAIERR